MNKNVKKSFDHFNKFTDKEIFLLIGIVPEKMLLTPIRKNTKEFKKETAGARLDGKSKILKLHKIYYDRILSGDLVLISFLKEAIEHIFRKVDNKIFEITKDDLFVNNALTAKEMDLFLKLIDILLDELKEEYIPLYFKFSNYELIDEHKFFLENDLKIAVRIKNEKTRITKDLSEQYEKINAEIKNANNEELKKLNNLIKEYEQVNLDINNKLTTEKARSLAFKEQIQSNAIQFSQAVEEFQNDTQKLKLCIEEICQEKGSLESTLVRKCNIIEELERRISLEHDKIFIEAKRQWESDNRGLLSIQRDLSNECEELRKHKETLLKDKELLLSETASLEKNIANNSETLWDIQTKFAESVFSLSLDKVYSENKFNSHTTAVDLSSRPYTREGEKHAIEFVCDNIEDFAGQIVTNLEIIGVKDVADEITDYIVGILSSGLTPLICSYKAREIATAVTMAYCGQTPYIITLPAGYSNSNELLELFHSCNSDSLLIEDAIGTMNENALLPILRERLELKSEDKLLFLATESVDSIRYMPNNFLNYLAIVRVDKFKNAKNYKYLTSNAKKVLNEFSKISNIDYEMRQVKKLVLNLGFGQPYSLSRANIVSCIRRLSSDMKFTFQSYLRTELSFLAMLQNKQTELEKNIQENSFDDSLRDIVKGAFNE